MRYPHILAAIRSAKWAVQPATLQAIRDLLSTRLVREHSLPFVHLHDGAATAPAIRTAPALGVAIVPVHGIIGKRLDQMETLCGGCDLDVVEAGIAAAVLDPAVRAIVLHFDSPGGVVTGVPELAEKIRAWSAQKPIHAFADRLMASAAYWLASACTSILCTPTADVGSIGVYMAAIDESEAWAQEGYRLVLVKAGARKAEGLSGTSITPETVAAWQAEVDAIYAMFAADVRAARPGVPEESMQGQTFMGERASEALLVDRVVLDLATVLRDLAAA